MKHDTRIKLIAGVILAASITLSTALTPALSAEAGRAQLGYADRFEESDPPEVALGVAMGAFRGLFVNMLWFRAQQLKDEGKFFEAIEVARAITRLQPRFPRVWIFHAWNLAYNISVATNTAEERWDWVNAGIRLLRDEGIPRNPNDTLLHKELAWIFVHKIQGFTDDANQYYKRRLAEEWTYIMGPPPDRPQPDDAEVQAIYARIASERAASGAGEASISDAIREAAIERRVDILRQIADAPSTLDEVIDAQPAARDLVRRLRDEAGVELTIDFLRLVETQRELYRMRNAMGIPVGLNATERNERFEEIFYDPEFTEAGRALLPYVRKRVLTRDFNMEIERMVRYTRQFGPLDWRHPASHSLYWASRGVEEGLRRRNIADFNMINTDRVVMQSVQELFRWGDLKYSLLTDSYVAFRNFDFVDAYTTAMDIVDKRAELRAEMLGMDAEDPDRHFRLLSEGYANFLRDVVRNYYRTGDLAKANEYYELLRTWPYLNINRKDDLIRELSEPLDVFVTIDFEERIVSPEVAQSEVVGALQDAIIRGILGNDRRVYQGQVQYAADVHAYYMNEQNRRTMVDAQSNRMQFLEPRFADQVAVVLVDLIAGGALGPEQGAYVWRRIPLGLAQVAYDRLAEALAGTMSREQFAIFYPEPPGMEEYRAMRDQLDQGTDAARQRLLNFERQ
jgi:hypothetical protein